MNRLGQETSPYLLQHRENPVHWYGWGPQAFETAKTLDRPVLLSSGYAACHWCHVMAHESFENAKIATFMNDHFINIKLDREERPDVDRLYMAALHAMGEQGGWPLTMFLTPDLKPFWGGTYFPPQPRYGRPGFQQVLSAIHNLWLTDRARAEGSARALTDHLNKLTPQTETTLPDAAALHALANTIASACDTVRGGLKGAPKFPQAPLFAFLWQQAQATHDPALEHVVVTTLHNISQGGIYDHLGGGLSRYSTDANWLVPHFEKMLYDNAQFISLASRTCLHTGNNLLASRIAETTSFLLSDMRTDAGLFTSAYDADSEGEEGKYYVWSKDEIRTVLANHELEEFCAIYGVTEEGNFEGRNILNRIQHPGPDDDARSTKLALARQELLQQRRNRVPPLHDDKSLADWNALAITALAEAALVFGEQQWLDAALDAHAAVIGTFWDGSTLKHSHRAGKTQHRATAHDFAQLIEASLTLAGIAARQDALDIAITLAQAFEQQHWSEDGAGFLLTARDANDLPANDISIQDDVTPSPNAVMVRNYVRLAFLSPGQPWRNRADAILARHLAVPLANPFAAPSLLGAAALAHDTWQITLCNVEAPIRHTLLRHVLKRTGLDAVIIHKRDKASPAGTFTLCKGTVCSLPIQQASDVEEAFRLFKST